MSAIDPFRKLVEEWDAFQDDSLAADLRIDNLKAENLALRARVRELEGGEAPPSKLERVPFTEPPLLLNHGSWDDSDYERGHVREDGKLYVKLAQSKQSKERVVRRDFGLQKPGALGGGFKREPAGVLRRYELKVQVPEDYDGAAEMVNLFQMHTHSAKAPPYWSFFLWSKDAYLRHNWPDGRRSNYNLGPIKRGHTYSLALEAVWSVDPDGRMRAWVDGEKLIDYSGPTYRDDEDEAPYLIFGPYAPSAIEAFKATFVFSEFKVGDL